MSGRGSLLAYERAAGDDRYLVLLNNATSATEVALADVYGAAIPDGVTLTGALGEGERTSTGGDLTVPLAATSSAVFEITGGLPAAPGPSDLPDDAPRTSTVAGNLQSELGCPGDWQPDCAATHLTYDADGEVWSAAFDVPAGSWEYKAALDGSWARNYGANAQLDGPNIRLELAQPRRVTFFFDHTTGWITDDVNSGHRDRAGQLPVRARLPRGLTARLHALLAAGPRR